MKKIVLTLAIAAASTLLAADGAALYKKCAACHGLKGEKKALNKSAVIQGWTKAQLVDSMKGYKAGTYGGPMKGLMKGQLGAGYDDAGIEAVAEYITTFK